jgi:hypothetical protein
VQKFVRSTMGSMADLIAQNTEDGPAPILIGPLAE